MDSRPGTGWALPVIGAMVSDDRGIPRVTSLFLLAGRLDCIDFEDDREASL